MKFKNNMMFKKIKEEIFYSRWKIFLILSKFLFIKNFKSLEVISSPDLKEKIIQDLNYKGEFTEKLFTFNKYPFSKWNYYFPIYEKYFLEFKDKPINLLEIGVDKGGSLELWKKYFGENVTLFGLDINPSAKNIDENLAKIYIGNQRDKLLLNRIVKNSPPDIIIDDGSHIIKDIKVTLETLFKHLKPGGIYIIEDLHTNYYKYWSGVIIKHNFNKYLREIIEDLHSSHHNKKLKHPDISNYCDSIYIHDSVVVIKKKETEKIKYPITFK